MPTIWTIAIDWNRDGDYSDSYEDVTSRVFSANWFLGTDKPYVDIAENSVSMRYRFRAISSPGSY